MTDVCAYCRRGGRLEPYEYEVAYHGRWLPRRANLHLDCIELWEQENGIISSTPAAAIQSHDARPNGSRDPQDESQPAVKPPRSKSHDPNSLRVVGGLDVVRQMSDAAQPVEPQSDALSDEALIDELASLSDIAYAKWRRKTARQLGIGVSQLDKAVKQRKAEIEDDASEPLFEHWNVEPWHEPVAGDVLLRALTERVRRHVVVTIEQATAVALWNMLTWVHDEAAVHSPLLLVRSAEPNSGKSTLLGVIGFLVQRGLSSVSITGPALFRSIEKWHPTFVLDENDTAFVNNDDLREVVNSGWTRGQCAIRCDPETNEPRPYSTFCAKAIGMKGRKLPDTTLSRAIVIELKRKLPGEEVRDFQHVDDDGLARLRRQCLRWANDNASGLAKAKPEMLPGFHNRTAANWHLMLAIAERCGAKQQAWQAARAIENVKDAREASLGIQLLSDIRDAFGKERANELTTKRLIEILTDDPERPWAEYKDRRSITPKQLGNLLREHGISSEDVRPPGGPHAKGYKLERFRDAFSRYLGI